MTCVNAHAAHTVCPAHTLYPTHSVYPAHTVHTPVTVLWSKVTHSLALLRYDSCLFCALAETFETEVTTVRDMELLNAAVTKPVYTRRWCKIDGLLQ